MTPNPWLLAALIVTTISFAAWVWLAEPWLDEHTRPDTPVADEVEAWLQETTR